MNISGILVVVRPESMVRVCDQLRQLPGIDVHFQDEESGRIVITQEAETISAEVAGLKRIRELEHVILAEMSSHYFEEDSELIDAIPAELDGEALSASRVPKYLNE